jgi:hypothetical protein
MPGLYLAALQASFERHLAARESPDTEAAFLALAARVAQSYAGFNAAAHEVVAILRGGIQYALQVCG